MRILAFMFLLAGCENEPAKTDVTQSNNETVETESENTETVETNTNQSEKVTNVETKDNTTTENKEVNND